MTKIEHFYIFNTKISRSPVQRSEIPLKNPMKVNALWCISLGELLILFLQVIINSYRYTYYSWQKNIIMLRINEARITINSLIMNKLVIRHSITCMHTNDNQTEIMAIKNDKILLNFK